MIKQTHIQMCKSITYIHKVTDQTYTRWLGPRYWFPMFPLRGTPPTNCTHHLTTPFWSYKIGPQFQGTDFYRDHMQNNLTDKKICWAHMVEYIYLSLNEDDCQHCLLVQVCIKLFSSVNLFINCVINNSGNPQNM